MKICLLSGVAGQVLFTKFWQDRLFVVMDYIKPSNILIDREGAARISDFGVAEYGSEGSAGIEVQKIRRVNMRVKQFILVGLCGLLTPLVGSAQAPVNSRTRALFVTRQADGIEVTVKWRDKNGRFIVIDPSREFKKGDELRVVFQSNFDGLVYFLNITPNGVLKVIHKDTVRADVLNELPTGPDTITFDNEPGTEALKIILARQPIDEFEEALKRPEGLLGKTASGVVDELSKTGGQRPKPAQISEEVGVVTPKPGQECGGLELSFGGKKINCRGMLIAKGNEKKGEGVVLVASPNSTQSGALQTGDGAVIELRFKHVKIPE